MEKRADPSLFVNDGSFMEKFMQLEREKKEKEMAALADSKSNTSMSSTNTSKTGIVFNKRAIDTKSGDKTKHNTPASGSKLAFSLKQKSKVVATPVKLIEEEDEDGSEIEDRRMEEPAKRQRVGQPDAMESLPVNVEVAPSPPSDHTVRQVADRLASLVAKNGRQFEHITRQRNPGDTPFKFLFDTSCSDYKYYEYRLSEEEKLIEQSKVSHASQTDDASASRSHNSFGRSSIQHHSSFQTPASALYEADLEGKGGASGQGESSAPPASDPIAMMEYYMKKAAQEERRRPPKQSKDEMPPPASLQAPAKRGHHMGDYIPPEELEKFLAGCNDVAAQRAAREAAEKAKIQADNVGHKLLSKMGWKEGEGLGSSKSGRADPVMAGEVKLNNLGVGASQPGEVTPEDDIYEQYKKRMMLGYRYRPNPLGNPRKAYY